MKKYIVSFDFWDTLVKNISYKRDRIGIIRDFLCAHGYHFFATEVEEAYGLIHQRIEQNKKNDENKYTCLEERISVILDKLYVQYDNQMVVQLIAILQKPVLQRPPILMPEVTELLQHFSTQAIIVCISDTGMTCADTVKQVLDFYEIGKYFNHFVFSEDVGYNKPDKRMFLPVINNVENIPVDRIFHVGDLYETDVKGAMGAGIHSIWLNSQKDYTKQLVGGVRHYMVTNLEMIKGILKEECQGD